MERYRYTFEASTDVESVGSLQEGDAREELPDGIQLVLENWNGIEVIDGVSITVEPLDAVNHHGARLEFEAEVETIGPLGEEQRKISDDIALVLGDWFGLAVPSEIEIDFERLDDGED